MKSNKTTEMVNVDPTEIVSETQQNLNSGEPFIPLTRFGGLERLNTPILVSRGVNTLNPDGESFSSNSCRSSSNPSSVSSTSSKSFRSRHSSDRSTIREQMALLTEEVAAKMAEQKEHFEKQLDAQEHRLMRRVRKEIRANLAIVSKGFLRFQLKEAGKEKEKTLLMLRTSKEPEVRATLVALLSRQLR
jgi:hypothetical protein